MPEDGYVSSLGTKAMHLSSRNNRYASQAPPVATTDLDSVGEWVSQKMSADELLKRYATGERDFSKVNLSDEILIWADLSGADLSGANLRGANLNWANLSGVDLRAADLSEADLAWANLNNADLREANLNNAGFSGADLHGADWSGAIMPDGTILPREKTNLASQFLSWLFIPFSE